MLRAIVVVSLAPPPHSPTPLAAVAIVAADAAPVAAAIAATVTTIVVAAVAAIPVAVWPSKGLSRGHLRWV